MGTAMNQPTLCAHQLPLSLGGMSLSTEHSFPLNIELMAKSKSLDMGWVNSYDVPVTLPRVEHAVVKVLISMVLWFQCRNQRTRACVNNCFYQ